MTLRNTESRFRGSWFQLFATLLAVRKIYEEEHINICVVIIQFYLINLPRVNISADVRVTT